MRASGVEPTLAVRRADDVAANIRYDEVARRVRGCTEWQDYVLTLEGPDTYQIFVDDVAPAPKAGTPNAWLWSAGFFAGEVPVEIVDSAGTLRLLCRIDVSPSPHKLGSEEFTAMLEELFAFAPAMLFGEEAAQSAIGTDDHFSDPHLVYARLKLFGPAFVQALNEVRRRPQLRLRYRRQRLPLHQVRRMDGATVRSAARDPATARILQLRSQIADAGTLASNFDVPSVEHTVDNPGNRVMLAVARAVLRRLRHVRSELERRSLVPVRPGESDDLKPRLPRRLLLLATLEDSLRAVVASAPFAEVSRPEISAAGLSTVAAHPAYARAYRSGWCALRPGIAGDRGDEQLWMSPTWQVYERWAFVQLVKILRKLLGGAAGQIAYPSKREDFVRFSCAHGVAKVQAFLQARFPAGDQPAPHGFCSISGERYPDLVVTVEHGGQRRFAVFDA